MVSHGKSALNVDFQLISISDSVKSIYIAYSSFRIKKSRLIFKTTIASGIQTAKAWTFEISSFNYHLQLSGWEQKWICRDIFGRCVSRFLGSFESESWKSVDYFLYKNYVPLLLFRGKFTIHFEIGLNDSLLGNLNLWKTDKS